MLPRKQGADQPRNTRAHDIRVMNHKCKTRDSTRVKRLTPVLRYTTISKGIDVVFIMM